MKNFVKIFMLVFVMAGLFTLSAFADASDVKYTKDGVEIVTADVAEAIANADDNSTIYLGEATYKLQGDPNKTLTFQGVSPEKTIINIPSGKPSFSVNATIKDVTINCDPNNNDYYGWINVGTMEYNGCIINNNFWNYSSNASFIGCTFNQTNSDRYNIWTYGGNNYDDSISFYSCTFNSAGKSMLVYTDQPGNGTVIIDNCKFYASQPVSGKAAIEVDSSKTTYNITISGNTTAAGFAPGSVSGDTLYNHKAGNNPANINLQLSNPAPAPAPAAPAVSNPYAVPATADNSNMPLWGLLFIAFAAVAVMTGKKRKA